MIRAALLILFVLFVTSNAFCEDVATLEIQVTPSKDGFEPGEAISATCKITNLTSETKSLIFDQPTIEMWVSGTINIHTYGWKSMNSKFVKLEPNATYLTTIQIRQDLEIPNLVEGKYRLDVWFGTTDKVNRFHEKRIEIVVKGESKGTTYLEVMQSVQDFRDRHPVLTAIKRRPELDGISNYSRGESWTVGGILVHRRSLDAQLIATP